MKILEKLAFSRQNKVSGNFWYSYSDPLPYLEPVFGSGVMSI